MGSRVKEFPSRPGSLWIAATVSPPSLNIMPGILGVRLGKSIPHGLERAADCRITEHLDVVGP